MKRKIYVKRVLAALLILVLSFSVISMAATVIFYGIFFTRSDTPAAYAMSYDIVDTAAYPRRKLLFPSGDNTLTAYCYSCSRPEGLVVIASGFREDTSAHMAETLYFVDHGYSVFIYDATGVGESEGSGTVGLTQPALDLRAALSYIADDIALSELPIYLYGVSAGGYAAAVNSDFPSLRAAVIISGFESPTLLMRETARSYVGVLADIEYPFLALEDHFLFGSAGQSASSVLSAAAIPVAVYEGSADTAVPAAARLSSYLDFDASDRMSYTLCDQPPRNGHSGLWLTDEAYGRRLSLTDGADMADAESIAAANEPDPEFMAAILTFYHNA